MFGISLPSYSHTSVPSSLRRMWGARSRHFDGRCLSNMSGGSTTWSSTLTRIRSSICTTLTILSAPVMRFEGRAMLVTGGASGMGQATVQRLLDEGASVASLDRRAEGVPDGALALTGDVSDEAAVAAAVAEAVSHLGGLQGVVTSAGVFVPGDGKPAADVELDDF